jgi:hypothetical protein
VIKIFIECLLLALFVDESKTLATTFCEARQWLVVSSFLSSCGGRRDWTVRAGLG